MPEREPVPTALEKHEDKRGIIICAGDVLYNPMDADKYHTVIADADGALYLGDYDSPLERYCPHEFWERVDTDRYGEEG